MMTSILQLRSQVAKNEAHTQYQVLPTNSQPATLLTGLPDVAV